ncbi:MAG: response regulator [Lachnospiraceae bacterium]|nr:response regulator [Lachnospiraceae bacterium]
MNDSRKERLVLAIATLAGISCILQNFFGGWEFWVPWVILLIGIVLWGVHLAEKIDSRTRMVLYFVYAAFLLFYHGIHETSLYDVSVAIALFMATFSIADRIGMLNLILTEYAIVMGIQFWFLYRNGQLPMSAFDTMRVVFHIGTVLTMYLFSRISVNRRVSERERIDEWRESVRKNDRDMEDFLSNVSHELRTPVNVISGMTTLMQKTNDSGELVTIQQAGIRLAHQIEDIQDYTEIKRGELALEEENYMCVSLINDVVSNYNAVYKNSNLELIIDLSPDTPSMLNGDIKKLHKLFRHLLDNAIKFTKRGGVNIKVFTVPQEYGVNLTIEITDTGIGMTRAGMARASKGLYQANKKRNRSTGGIGIGLPIVYGFVHKMGGFVMINSEERKGTSVRLSIPQKVVDPAPCLSLNDKAKNNFIFYSRLDKFKVPEVREFYKSMAVNLATGLNTKLYSANEKGEIERLIKEIAVSHIFMGQEEFEADREWLERLSAEGYKIVISADPEFQVTSPNGVLVMPKPLYSFPVVRILNGEMGMDPYLAEDKNKVDFTGVRALVVDDEPMNLVVASGLLREYKMSADTAQSGREAIKKYEGGAYDIIFMDHMMPEMDGVEAMKQIRQIAASDGRTPIIVALTANALSGAREMFIKEGFDGFIAKPIDIGVFERVMKRVLPDEMIHYEGRVEA